jgi:hypothetical protein
MVISDMSSLTRQAEQRSAAKDSRDELDFQSALCLEVEEDFTSIRVCEPVESSLECDGCVAPLLGMLHDVVQRWLLLDWADTAVGCGWSTLVNDYIS